MNMPNLDIELQDFLRQVVSPDLDTLPVLADWLEDWGDDRAAMVRGTYDLLTTYLDAACQSCLYDVKCSQPDEDWQRLILRCPLCGAIGPDRQRWTFLTNVLRLFGFEIEMPEPPVPKCLRVEAEKRYPNRVIVRAGTLMVRKEDGMFRPVHEGEVTTAITATIASHHIGVPPYPMPAEFKWIGPGRITHTCNCREGMRGVISAPFWPDRSLATPVSMLSLEQFGVRFPSGCVGYWYIGQCPECCVIYWSPHLGGTPGMRWRVSSDKRADRR